MGIEYVMVDSSKQRHFLGERGESRIQVNLNNPILNATSVRVADFSVPNEMYNVRFGENTFTLMLYTLSGVNSMVKQTYTIQPGLYTIGELVSACNEQITGTPIATLTVTFELLANNKVSVQAISTGTQQRRLIMYVNGTYTFHNCIFHRLGFNRNQVFLSSNRLAASDFKNNSFTLWNGVDGTINGVTETAWTSDNRNPLIWRTNTPGETHVGNNIGFEAYSHLLLKSDLVSNDFQSIHMNEEGHTLTTNENILQKINTTVSHYNFLHLDSNSGSVLVHQLSGKPIHRFMIELTDDVGKGFGTHESKEFNVILRFDTVDPDTRASEQNALENQKRLFAALHKCGIV